MSHTLTHHAFAGLSEEGANDLLEAFFTARPHYLVYGSPPFVTANSASTTMVSPIAAPPLLASPIPFLVRFSIPTLDLYPPDGPLPAPLTLNPGQFAARTTLELTILCGRKERMSTSLDLWAVGRLITTQQSGGTVAVGFEADEVAVTNVMPATLRDILDCILLEVLRGILSSVSIPLPALSAGFFSLAIEQGPEIDPDVIDAWGDA